jgi:hypothetical protein
MGGAGRGGREPDTGVTEKEAGGRYDRSLHRRTVHFVDLDGRIGVGSPLTIEFDFKESLRGFHVSSGQFQADYIFPRKQNIQSACWLGGNHRPNPRRRCEIEVRRDRSCEICSCQPR